MPSSKSISLACVLATAIGTTAASAQEQQFRQTSASSTNVIDPHWANYLQVNAYQGPPDQELIDAIDKVVSTPEGAQLLQLAVQATGRQINVHQAQAGSNFTFFKTGAINLVANDNTNYACDNNPTMGREAFTLEHKFLHELIHVAYQTANEPWVTSYTDQLITKYGWGCSRVDYANIRNYKGYEPEDVKVIPALEKI